MSWNKSNGPIQFGANYTFSKDLATAASYNNVIPDPLNLRNEYNPVPFDRTQVFNIHYLVDFGTRYHGDITATAQAANGWQISGISSVQSGPPLASLTGQNFGFGYGQIQPVQVYSTPQQESQTAESNLRDTFGIPADKNGNHYCVTNVNPTVWLGSPDYQLQPTVQLQSDQRIEEGSVRKSNLLRYSTAGRTEHRCQRAFGESDRPGPVPPSLYSRTRLTSAMTSRC